MKVLFLHLSDIHILNKKSCNLNNINNIVNSLNVVQEFEKITIIVSGDITFSGTKSQFELAKKLLGSLISGIKEKFKYFEKIDVLVVPGNHDINHGNSALTSSELNEYYKFGLYDENLNKEENKISEFLCFAKYNGCFTQNSIFDNSRFIDCNGLKIGFNLINSAFFSLKDDEDKGLHYLPNKTLNDITEEKQFDIVITVMHHSPEWFCDDIKHKLEECIQQNSTINFFGHEHYSESEIISSNANGNTVNLKTGALLHGDNWANSTFCAHIMDTEQLQLSSWLFKLTTDQKIYKHEYLGEIKLTKKESFMSLKQKEDYIEQLKKDLKRTKQDDFTKTFVFPRLFQTETEGTEGTVERKKEILSIEQFKTELEENRRIMIFGGNNYGKTLLLKWLLLHFRSSFAALYIDAADISGSNYKRMLENNFLSSYTNSANSFEKFEQLPKDKKLLIIDNIDHLPEKQLNFLLEKVEEDFGYYVLSSKKHIEFDALERLKKVLNKEDKIIKFDIAPWFSDKRLVLIEKIVNILWDGPNKQEIANQLNTSIKHQQNFFNLNPDFITQFVEYFCKNALQTSNDDSNVFSKVFEANLTSSIKQNLIRPISVDKVFTILSKIAYNAHKTTTYPIPESELNSVIDTYNADYDDVLSAHDIIDITLKSSVMIKKDNKYRFSNKNYLAYFIAREINQKYNEDRDDTDIKSILDLSCFSINSDILMFLIYITDNNRILWLILEMAKEYTKGWNEFDFNNCDLEYLNLGFQYDVKQLSDDDIKSIETQDIEKEKNIANNDFLNAIDVYDYSTEESNTFLNQLIRAINVMATISRCLPCFEHNMKKTEKEEFVKMIYKLPNQIFYSWAKEIDDNKDELVKYLCNQLTSSYLQQKTNEEIKELSEKVSLMLMYDSTSLLLEIYNLAVFNATKDNTIGYLSNFNYECRPSYSLEHLMMLSNRNRPEEFITSAEKLLKENQGKLPAILVKRVANHALQTLKNLDRPTKARLINKCFQDNSKNFMLLKPKNED